MNPPTQTEAGRAELEFALAASGFRLRELQPLAGDVSPRRYARLAAEDGTTAILATYTEDIREICPRFLRTSALLEEAGVRVPRILASDCAQGWMLLEDLGPNTLGEWKGRPWDEILPYFERALDLADRIARLPTESLDGLNPLFGSGAAAPRAEADLGPVPGAARAHRRAGADRRTAEHPGRDLRDARRRDAGLLPPRLHGAEPDAAS